MPAKKIRCSLENCRAVAQKISGDCNFCKGHYCSSHRLLEDHRCQGLEDVSCTDYPSQWWLVGLSDVLSEDLFANLLVLNIKCKKEAFEANAMQLNRERTQVIKGV
ncbi:AN1-type zinc finger protein TMC1 [Podospora fimiseda]|uniref:AN1-type zinc finger protein TMC1 n=1 Tax=Podospora fimiseda TaxID=252190 RepID=A0AAN6YKL6_9PEZI|nr:AN1-type zinc finger protein TMC1 [Podospora fimiseda]